MGAEIEKEIVCTICQVVQKKVFIAHLHCVCVLSLNEPSGLFIESPSLLSAFPAIITERAAGNVVHALSEASVWSSLSHM